MVKIAAELVGCRQHNLAVQSFNRPVNLDETTGPPVLYQKYVGHDNNRDWFMNNMLESQAVSYKLYNEWYPQIVYNHHQTGPAWARIFLPPFSEKTLAWIKEVKPKKAFLTHMTSDIDYEEISKKLPSNVEPAYDGLVINI